MVTDMTFLSKVGSNADAEAEPLDFPSGIRTLVALRAISASHRGGCNRSRAGGNEPDADQGNRSARPFGLSPAKYLIFKRRDSPIL
jgi:hypothetical protein